MAIQVRCSCGKQLLVKDDWKGRLVKCPQCGVVLEVPSTEFAPQPGWSETDDRLSGRFAPQHQAPAKPTVSPFAADSPPAKSKSGWFSWLFWEFPRFGSALKWNEPFSFRVRLRSDVLRRLAIVLAVWAAGTGGFLALFAVNRNPPEIPLAIGLAAIFGGIAALLMFGRREHVSGRVIFGKDGIRFERTYASLGFPGNWYEWTHWPYAGIDCCMIVPADLLEKSFSVMLVYVGSQCQLIGIPKKINLDELKRHLEGMGVPVKYDESVPADYTQPLDIMFPAMVTAVCSVCFLAGFGFYALAMGGLRPPQAQAEKALQAQFNEMQERAEKARLDAEPFRSGLSRLDLDAQVPQFPNEPRPQAAAPAAGDANDSSAFDGSDAPGSRRFGRRFPPGVGDFGNNQLGQEMMPQGLPRFRPLGVELEQPENGYVGPAPATPRPPRSGMPAERLLPGDTELVGGNGGIPFRSTNRDGLPVIGFRYAVGSWSGKAALRKLEPLYDQSPAGGIDQTLVAREGYAVGAVVVGANEFVTAVQVTFMRLSANGQLDQTDSYTSDWIGEPPAAASSKLGGTGAKVLGVHGRAAAVLDALGLVMEPR